MQKKEKMTKMSVAMMLLLLLLIDVIIIVTSTKMDVVQVVSFRKARKVKNGPAMCALDPANKTISSSSAEHCSLDCTRDATCASFNLNDSTCALYNYKPKVLAPVSKCENYQVSQGLLRRGMEADCLHFKPGGISIFQGELMV